MLKRFDINSPEGDLMMEGLTSKVLGGNPMLNTVSSVVLLDKLFCYLLTVNSIWLGSMMGRDFEKLKKIEREIREKNRSELNARK